MSLSGIGYKSTTTEDIYPWKGLIAEHIIDGTTIKVGFEYIWLWVAIEPKDKEILEISVPKERNMFVV
jgi:hypothetical protein